MWRSLLGARALPSSSTVTSGAPEPKPKLDAIWLTLLMILGLLGLSAALAGREGGGRSREAKSSVCCCDCGAGMFAVISSAHG
jgi:hypothetical protein